MPITGVPASSIGGNIGGSSVGTASVGRAKAGASAPPTGTVTGTASVSSPVIARAAVAAPPAGPVTTVTGTGLRQSTGATSAYVPTVTAPTRPAGGQTTATRPTEAGRLGRGAAGAATRGPRRARLHLKRIDPWSVMKFSFAVSFVLFFVAIVATSVLYLALDAMGVWDSVNTALSDVIGDGRRGGDSFKITAQGVIGTAVLLGAVNVVLFTALTTLGAFVYNVCADLVGGIELTLSEKD